MKKLIYLEDAIDAICKKCKADYPDTTACDICDDISVLKSLPSAQPEPQWIPVSERLPEKAGKYLVTVKNGNVYAGTFDQYSGRFQCAATAWMPLPEPYSEPTCNDDSCPINYDGGEQ